MLKPPWALHDSIPGDPTKLEQYYCPFQGIHAVTSAGQALHQESRCWQNVRTQVERTEQTAVKHSLDLTSTSP